MIGKVAMAGATGSYGHASKNPVRVFGDLGAEDFVPALGLESHIVIRDHINLSRAAQGRP